MQFWEKKWKIKNDFNNWAFMAMVWYYAVKQWNRMMNPAMDSCKYIEIYKTAFAFYFMHIYIYIYLYMYIVYCLSKNVNIIK